MLDFVIAFLLVALLASLLGFPGIGFMSIEIARLLFFIFLILLVISLIVRLLRGKSPLP